jgi:uroporphyrin-III C-methyltransferase/precorrin-2 dehydrogenase/sirohydrochlorin ferrochelatase
VVNAGRAQSRSYAGNLDDLARGAVEFSDGPAVILIGRAVAHGDWVEAVASNAESFKVA